MSSVTAVTAHAGSGHSSPGLTSVPPPEPEPRAAAVVWGLLAATLLPRLLAFPFAENLYGDAVVRTELAQRWAASPHWISSFADGAFQFGPLHLYVIGLVLKLGVPREDAGRWVSLVLGVLSVVPLYALTRRLFGWRAGVVAGLGFAAWGLHLQMSTTAGSEALTLFLVLWVLELLARALEENRFGPLAGAALVLNLACATRYDCWLLVPLLSGLIFLEGKDRVAAATRAVLFGLLCLPFPLVWMQGNELAKGSAFYPIHYIEDFHRAWVADGVGRWGQLGYRLQNLVFWPATALVTLSPLVALFGMVGMARAYRERPQARLLLWVAWVPTLYLTSKGAVLLNFVPLARFTADQVVLVLPFVAFGFDALFGTRRPAARRALWALTGAVALAVPVTLGVLTVHKEDRVASALRPVSPISTNPPAVMQVARFLHQKALPTGEAAILDMDGAYWDLQVAFFSGLPETRLARFRWDTFQKRIAERHPRYLVLEDGGALAGSGVLTREAGQVTLDGRRFRELPGFAAPFHVYEAP